MFNKVLVANRGEIACRIIRTLREMNIASVAVYSAADADSLHVSLADEAYAIGEAPAKESYLNIDRILRVIAQSKAEAVHPGYGFLSENVEFSKACADMDVVFIGPENRHILEFGLKHRARLLAEKAGVPLIPGTGLLNSLEEAVAEAELLGYPVMLKSTAGGGGIGMRICNTPEELSEAYAGVKILGKNNFSDDGVFLEKYIRVSRHIEVQIFGAGDGRVVVLGERDCSVQRRNQKVIEETPAPGISAAVREQLHASARTLAETVAYRSAGTVEFIYDTSEEKFYFLEVNTRLQVEHGITEELFRVDLVRWMLELAAGEDPLAGVEELKPSGAAIEMRIYAEDPGKAYQPSSGLLTCVQFPEGVRCDTWVQTGTEVSAFYDPLLAKLIVWGKDRNEAIEKSLRAVHGTELSGFETNLLLLEQTLQSSLFGEGAVYTRMLDSLKYTAETIEVLSAGTQTTVQDVPGRIGYWGVGVPPSGPMDSLNFRIANSIVGNCENAPALEMTFSGAVLRFNTDAVIALCGASVGAKLNAAEVALYCPLSITSGDTLSIGTFECGQRLYLAVRGGIAVPEYMGSASTFTLGRFGGHGGRALAAGDILHIGEKADPAVQPACLAESAVPEITDCWQIGVMYGPHGAPDFFTDRDITTFLDTEWEVHFNSSRTGVRLIGPKPEWARTDGGEAGLHPSNIHDNAYAVGAVDFTGDMPVILGPDGPSLGGFVCPVTVVEAELWKVGQLRAGDRVKFIPVTPEEARKLYLNYTELLRVGTPLVKPQRCEVTVTPAIIRDWNSHEEQERIVCRQAGDCYLLLEFGKLELDLELRFKVHAWGLKFAEMELAGIVDITPGIRSLQLHFDPDIIARDKLLLVIDSLVAQMAKNCPEEVKSRIVYLPLSWDDPATREAIQKYTSAVRKDAPWCPSNIEFIRRINGLDSIYEVQDILFSANYLVMGLGDVYLGAPVATPVDPRHRLVTTKYNPARTWTPENAVGIGGAYLCVYGMEGPGGYQFVGRTVQMWNRYQVTDVFEAGKPWLLRPFDQIKFYPVSGEELLQMRRDFISGRFSLRIEETSFNIRAYTSFLAENCESITEFKQRQQEAFDTEYRYWVANNLLTFQETQNSTAEVEYEVLAGAVPVESAVSGCIWKYNVDLGFEVDVGDEIIVLESMKTEIAVRSPVRGRVVQVMSSEGCTIKQGQYLCSIEPA